MARGEGVLLNRLAQGIQSVSDLYDVVVLDPPPALGAISLSVLRAANALVVPVPPTVMDFSSTAAFLTMLSETMHGLRDGDGPTSPFYALLPQS
jgi:chromosome partitioning protein